METGVIYKIQNKNNGKIYIGMSSNYKKRWTEHKGYLRRSNHPNEHLQRSWNKHGKENFVFSVIDSNIPLEDLADWEMYYINEIYNTFKGKGYNNCVGGYQSHTEESRKKISESQKGYNNSSAVLTKKDGLKIYYKYYNSELNREELANKYDVSGVVVGQIINFRHWITKDMPKSERVSKEKIKRKKRISKGKYSKKFCLKIYKIYFTTNKSQQDLEDEFGICRDTVREIIHYRHWATKNMPEICRIKNNKEKIKEKAANRKYSREECLSSYRYWLKNQDTKMNVAEKFKINYRVFCQITNHKHWTTKDLTKEEIMNME